ncbi:WecB/TagA/CpsF family glycosyltransferase [Paenibacillus sp. J31TS4]|uniref:WecB/TagA/CpsF family glycosyltransferase n=1 Tax=Paenibacillus sp. J31TS4 TaxID=2807195 RepID=UPI002795A250|nr:WecB/TagA/CpsF family glycosyltransferase [Paenibacillus sp. J31TS4]
MGIPFPKLTFEKAVHILEEVIDRPYEKLFHVITVNPEIVMSSQHDKRLRAIVDEAGLITADGIGIVKISQVKGNGLPERVTGYDMMMRLLETGNRKGWSFYLLGCDEETSVKAAETIRERYPNVRIAGRRNGFFKPEDDEAIVRDIQAARPDVLLVALGAPKAEEWIYRYKAELPAKLAMGIGGSLDVLAGKVKRAPVFWQKANLEWLYRLLNQPSRWRRQLVLPKFAVRALLYKEEKER